MDSLYGGRPGTPFVLKTSFKTINEMKEAFSKGSSYTKCYYGEYCIIDTLDKRNPDNGKVYRRDYTGASYIGQIVGPNGLEISNLKIVKYNSNDVVYDSTTFKEDKDGHYKPDVFELETPGSTVVIYDDNEITLKDGYKYITYEVKNPQYGYDENGESKYETWTCFLAYYNVIDDFKLNVDSGQLTKEYTASVDNDETFLTWVKNISVDADGTIHYDTTTGNGEEIEAKGNYDKTKDYKQSQLISWINSISLDKETGAFNITLNNGSKTGGDLSSENTETSQINKNLTWIKNISVDADGTIHYDTTTGDDEAEVEFGSEDDDKTQNYKQSNLISWIDKISLNKETGAFNITLNNGSKNGGDFSIKDNLSQINKNLTWVKNISVDEYGTIHYDTTTGNGTEVEATGNYDKTQDYKQSNLISWIKDIGFNIDKSSITFTGNNGKLNKTYYLPYIKNIQYNDLTGKLTGGYVDSTGKNATVDLNNDENKIKYIKDIKIENGQIISTNNIGETKTIEDKYNVIDNIALTDNNEIQITYSSNSGKNSDTFAFKSLLNLVDVHQLSNNETIEDYLVSLKNKNIENKTGLYAATRTENGQNITYYIGYRSETDEWVNLGTITSSSSSGSSVPPTTGTNLPNWS